MNRLKFHIWDNLMKLWLCEDSQYLQMDGNKVHAAPWSTIEWDIPSDRYTIVQYTGLQDRDGKDIYEGDILERVRSPGEKHNYYQVVWHNYMYIAICLRKNYSHCLDQFSEVKQTKIVGNIFENKKLLN